MKCKNCGYEYEQNLNFCIMCGKKLVEICNCWIKKEPYNCGQEKCPGYRLHVLEHQMPS